MGKLLGEEGEQELCSAREGILRTRVELEGRLNFDQIVNQMHFGDLQGKFTIVQVDIQQLYVHCVKKSTRVPVSPVF